MYGEFDLNVRRTLPTEGGQLLTHRVFPQTQKFQRGGIEGLAYRGLPMPSICLYFQVHQPNRLKHFSYFDSTDNLDYFNDVKNAEIMKRVAERCYIPANTLMLGLIERYKGRFKIAYSLSGVVIEQMKRFAPEALESFVALAKTGCVEFLAETYYHSLSFLHDEDEYREQLSMHTSLIEEVFGVTPRVLRNTELIYCDQLGTLADGLGYKAILAEGVDSVLEGRTPDHVYRHPEKEIRVLLRNYRLSDDIAFRFSNRAWSEYPLTADKYAGWLKRVGGEADTINLFMDYETLGEHQWESSGIFEFMRYLPDKVLEEGFTFSTPSEVIEQSPVRESLRFSRVTSWADAERDISAWSGNSMQNSASNQLYTLGKLLRERGDEEMLDVWRKLQTSDHLYYMCTKPFADGEVHAYFSPFQSPYDAFITYMNVLKDFSSHVISATPGLVKAA